MHTHSTASGKRCLRVGLVPGADPCLQRAPGTSPTRSFSAICCGKALVIGTDQSYMFLNHRTHRYCPVRVASSMYELSTFIGISRVALRFRTIKVLIVS